MRRSRRWRRRRRRGGCEYAIVKEWFGHGSRRLWRGHTKRKRLSLSKALHYCLSSATSTYCRITIQYTVAHPLPTKELAIDGSFASTIHHLEPGRGQHILVAAISVIPPRQSDDIYIIDVPTRGHAASTATSATIINSCMISSRRTSMPSMHRRIRL